MFNTLIFCQPNILKYFLVGSKIAHLFSEGNGKSRKSTYSLEDGRFMLLWGNGLRMNKITCEQGCNWRLFHSYTQLFSLVLSTMTVVCMWGRLAKKEPHNWPYPCSCNIDTCSTAAAIVGKQLPYVRAKRARLGKPL